MNITSCPQCGGRVRSVTIGWKCENCNGFIDIRGEFHQHKEELFMPPTTNADRIRTMSDEELAKFISIQSDDCLCAGNPKCDYHCGSNLCLKVLLDWLQQPAEEDT